jgi:hypothetical protein
MKILTEFMCVKYRPVTGLRTGYQNLLESISDLPLALLHEAVRIRFLRFVVHNCPAVYLWQVVHKRYKSYK